MFYPAIATAVDPADRQCTRCRRDCSDGPPEARYCPGCGARLPRRLALLLRHMGRRASQLRQSSLLQFGPMVGRTFIYRGPSDRSLMLTGYGNALFNLGWTYERRPPAMRNLPEALRCYTKSARLGNLDAAVRLAVSSPDALPTPPAPTDRRPSLTA